MALEFSEHIVKKDETLSSIARNYDLPDYRYIYNHPKNETFKSLRPFPDKINPGDSLLIPPSPENVIRDKIQTLEKCKENVKKTYLDAERELENNLGNAQNLLNRQDAIGAIAAIMVPVGGTVVSGYGTMGKSGVALAKANAKFMRSFLKGSAISKSLLYLEHVSGLNQDPNATDPLYVAVPKIMVKSFFEMLTPSYWIQRWSGVNLNDFANQIRKSLSDQQMTMIKHYDERIDYQKNELLMITKDRLNKLEVPQS